MFKLTGNQEESLRLPIKPHSYAAFRNELNLDYWNYFTEVAFSNIFLTELKPYLKFHKHFLVINHFDHQPIVEKQQYDTSR